MKLKFWGTRGSIPSPGSSTVKYGGNTTCFELRLDDDRLIVIDAGSGIRELGMHILKHDFSKGQKEFDLVFTHTHWDHILGFPFFTPIYIPGTKIHVHGPSTFTENSLEKVLRKQMSYHVFPVDYNELGAEFDFHYLKEEEWTLGKDCVVKTKYLNHPVSALAYRFESNGRSLVVVFDHEPYSNLFPSEGQEGYDENSWREAEEAVKQAEDQLSLFLSGADLVIHDAQYEEAEYKEKFLGWGHSPYPYPVEKCIDLGIPKLILAHHDPTKSDKELDALSSSLQAQYTGKIDLSFAKEGDEIHL